MSFMIFQNEKTPLQAIRTRSSKDPKIAIFPVNPWFWSKNGHFSNFFLLDKIGQENVFYDNLERKTPFQAIKTRSSKDRKIAIFPKGLTHGFGPKMAIFPTFFFQAIQAKKMSFTILQNKKTPFQAIKTRSSKSRKIDIFSKGLTHGFGPKMAIFPTFFFQEIQVRKMSFTIFQSGKRPFQGIKTRSSKDRKIAIFPKGLTHGFDPQMAMLRTFFLGNIDQKNVFYDILEWKNAFLGYKNKKFKRSKN